MQEGKGFLANLLRKKLSVFIGLLVLSGILIFGFTMAFFTDRDEDAVSAKTGTLRVSQSEITLSNADNINPGDNDIAYIKANNVSTTPHDLAFSVENKGNKSIRTRHTLLVSVKGSDGKDLSPSVFSLLNGETELTGKMYVKADGSTSQSPEDAKVLKYVYESDTLNGIGIGAESEDGAAGSSKDYLYKLAMDRDSGNEYQGSSLIIESVIEAIQYRNTVSEDWNVVSSQKFVSSTGADIDTVEKFVEP